MEKQDISEHGLRGTFYRPSGTQRRAIVYLGGSEGGLPPASLEPHLKNVLDQGHPILCLAYFGTEGLPKSLEKIPLEYFEQTFDWLSRQPGIPGEYAIIGGSKGGELALLLASRYPQIKAVVAFVPSHVIWQGIPNGFPKGPLGSSWSYAGKNVPFVPLRFSLALIRGIRTFRFREAYEISLGNKKRVAEAVIPVEKINGPLLLISGKADTMWPSTPMCERIMSRLSANNFPFPYRHEALDCGHGVGNAETFWPLINGFIKENFM